MRRSNRELWLAFIAILFISVIYLFIIIILDGIPRASDLFGHAIGILGFVLMMMTETLYSFRKRSRRARWGRMSAWLDFHIFTGVVGPYMVLLHSSWKFNGLAGIVMLLTIIVVASGFMGRYIYTSVPRTADGVEIEASQLEARISETEAELQSLLRGRPDVKRLLPPQLVTIPKFPQNALAIIMERSWVDLRQRLNWWIAKRRLDLDSRVRIEQFEKLIKRQGLLRRQLASLAMARRLLALWHAVHIPIGMALFTAGFIHIGAALYYATLLR
jgi:hypothetical protein